MNVLLKFRHGLGDAVQFTAVLAHLRRHRPQWIVDVASLVGKHTAFTSLCRKSLRLKVDSINESEYDQVWNLDWQECNQSFADSPSTKVERCLREVFGLVPEAGLWGYQVTVAEKAKAQAGSYLRSVAGDPAGDGRYRVALIHYQGNTSAHEKNISHDAVRALCDELLSLGATPIILDWDRRSPLPDGQRIHCPVADHPLWGGTGTGDAEMAAALIGQASLMIGIDSGPQKIAAATDTPTVAVWTGHHPVHYFCTAANVMHVVPTDHSRLIRGNREDGRAFFEGHYRFKTYDDITRVLIEQSVSLVQGNHPGLTRASGFWVHVDNVDQDLVVIKDIFEKDSYRVAQVELPLEIVVDVGAHIGTFAARWHRRNPNARIICIEACPENIEALRANVGGYAEVLAGACTYELGPVLLNAVRPNCQSTGGSRIVSQSHSLRELDPQYRVDDRPVARWTLEEIMAQFDLERIDVLKLDCEGSEFSILENASCLDRVRLILGEYHGRQQFLDLVQRRFRGWKLRILLDGDPGTFWLCRPS